MTIHFSECKIVTVLALIYKTYIKNNNFVTIFFAFFHSKIKFKKTRFILTEKKILKNHSIFSIVNVTVDSNVATYKSSGVKIFLTNACKASVLFLFSWFSLFRIIPAVHKYSVSCQQRFNRNIFSVTFTATVARSKGALLF